jgi:hypothetical protein
MPPSISSFSRRTNASTSLPIGVTLLPTDFSERGATYFGCASQRGGLVRGSDYAAMAFGVLVSIATPHFTVAQAEVDDVRFH